MKMHKDNADKMMELNKQMMEQLPIQMKQSFKLIIITMIPLLILFAWLRNVFAQTAIASTWIWWYIGVSLVVGITLGKVLNRPAVMPAPAFMIRLVLGEFGNVLLDSQRAMPDKLLQHGFQFKYPDIEKALAAVI